MTSAFVDKRQNKPHSSNIAPTSPRCTSAEGRMAVVPFVTRRIYLLDVVADPRRRGGVLVLLEELLHHPRLIDAGFLFE